MKITDLNPTEYNEYYSKYIGLVSKQQILIDGFTEGLNEIVNFFESIPEVKLNYAYGPDKWTVKEVFQHVIDTERIFQYRCFCIARRDKNILPGFEQNDYIKPSQAKNKSLESLIDEFKTVRSSFIVLLASLQDEDLRCIGDVSGNPMSARAAAFIVLGHHQWHINIIKEHYL